jgi:hypothetical protein
MGIYIYIYIYTHTREGPEVSGLTYKSRAKWKMLRGIYSAICGEVNISVSGGYVLQYAGGTRASSCFISVTLKSWSGRKHLDPTTYICSALCFMQIICKLHAVYLSYDVTKGMFCVVITEECNIMSNRN